MLGVLTKGSKSTIVKVATDDGPIVMHASLFRERDSIDCRISCDITSGLLILFVFLADFGQKIRIPHFLLDDVGNGGLIAS